MEKIKVNENFKAVIPITLTEILNVNPGDSVTFEQIDNKICIKKSI